MATIDKTKKAMPEQTLMTRYLAHIERVRKTGKRLAAYGCPGCNFAIETLVPARGEQFDTLVECPKCGDQHFRIIRNPRRGSVWFSCNRVAGLPATASAGRGAP